MVSTTHQPLFPVNYRHRIQVVRTGTPVSASCCSHTSTIITPELRTRICTWYYIDTNISLQHLYLILSFFLLFYYLLYFFSTNYRRPTKSRICFARNIERILYRYRYLNFPLAASAFPKQDIFLQG